MLMGLFTTAAWNVLARFMAPPDAKRWSDSLVLAGGLLWIAGSLIRATLLVYGFHCPRCGNLFYLKGYSRNHATGKCLHCGLRKGAVEPFAVREGEAPVRLPLFIQSQELRVFTSVNDAERYLLAPEVHAQEGFDSAGLRLRLQERVRGGLFGLRSERVLLERGEAQPTGQPRLRQLLEAALKARGASHEGLGRASLDELVEQAARVLTGAPA